MEFELIYINYLYCLYSKSLHEQTPSVSHPSPRPFITMTTAQPFVASGNILKSQWIKTSRSLRGFGLDPSRFEPSELLPRCKYPSNNAFKSTLDSHFHFNSRVRIVAFNLKVFSLEVIDFLNFSKDSELGERPWFSLKLKTT